MRYFDLEKIEQDDGPLSPSEQEVQARLGYDVREPVIAKLDLEAALKTLTPKQTAVFLLLADGKTEREMARTLHISQPDVNKLLAKATTRLRKILQGGYQTP